MFDLVAKLEKYKSYDGDEENSRKQIIEFLRNNENAFSRENKAGHVTAGAFVCDETGNILLNHHKKADMWFQFGGHSDGESDSFAVAKREVYEECGICEFEEAKPEIFDVSVQEISFNEAKNEPMHLHYDINFLFITKDKNFTISGESSEIKWVTLSQAKELVSEDDIPMQRMMKKYEEMINNQTTGR